MRRLFSLFKWQPWMRVPVLILGVICLVAAIWFGFPMIPLAVFSTLWLRASVIGVLLAIIFVVQFLKFRRRRKQAQDIEDELTAAPQGDGQVLAERMQAALAKLKKAGGSTFLYDLPWYVIIGPPGAGKTTALKNSGIEFPASEADDGPMEGFGGTRYCDWWFAEDAIMIDTAGRYTTQDSDAEADATSWTAFLNLLKRSRPDQPINGVILAFSAEDMMTTDAATLEAHAETVRTRLAELHDTLRIDFPVYVMFTKADLISGFREYFSSFNLQRRKAVWGVTFQTKDRKAPTHENVAPEFDKLVSRLSDELIDRLSEEPDGISRIAIFGLPGQMALLRDNTTEFLRKVFAPSKHKTNAILRGFYFTSGTQEGTPIDQVLGAMAQSNDAGAAMAPAFMSGQGKSFFIHDLLRRVIFAERDWVSFDARAVRRAKIFRGLGLGLVTAATLGLVGAFGWSFWQNRQLVETAETEAQTYARAAQVEIAQTEISDPDLLPVLPYLEQLRTMPAGYGNAEDPTFWEGLGLGQRDRLQVAARASYGDALEQMLRPRLILDVEEDMPDIRAGGEPAEIYRALKVYMLLGGKGDGPDDAAIRAWFEDVWRAQLTGFDGVTQREQLLRHLDAMLALDDTREIAIAIDEEVVTAARGDIVRMSVADQAYALISDRARGAQLPPFNLVDATGNDALRVFTAQDGSDVVTLEVPGLYTYEGFWSFFVDQLREVRDALERDKWVLGEQADLVDFDAQLRGLDSTLQARYGREFKAAWDAMLDNVALANMSADKPSYDLLAAAASPVSSPILKLVEGVAAETKLTAEFDKYANMSPEDLAALAAGGGGGGGGAGVGEQVGGRVVSNVRRRSSFMTRIIIDSVAGGAAKSQERVNGTSEDTIRRPMERIEQQFQDWHLLVAGEAPNRPIDIVLADLMAIRDNLRLGEANPAQTAALLPQLLSNLTRNNSRLPGPVRDLVTEAERDFREEGAASTIAEMNAAMNRDIAFNCSEGIGAFFPFSNSPRHLPPPVFGQFFGPGGDMDRYFSTYLAPHVIRTADGLSIDPNSPLADRISPATLRQFDRAEKIRRAFFGAGGTLPEVQMTVALVSAHSSIETARFEVNGQNVLMAAGDAPKPVQWPGSGGSAAVQVFPDLNRQSARAVLTGPWAIIGLMRSAESRQQEGSRSRLTFQIGGRAATFDIGFNAVTNPFTMPELSEFSCPQSLD